VDCSRWADGIVLVRFGHLPVNRRCGLYPAPSASDQRWSWRWLRPLVAVTMRSNSARSRTLARQGGSFFSKRSAADSSGCGLDLAWILKRPVDIDDAAGWRRCLESHGWDWIRKLCWCTSDLNQWLRFGIFNYQSFSAAINLNDHEVSCWRWPNGELIPMALSSLDQQNSPISWRSSLGIPKSHCLF